jgi:hypothetical protein
MPNPKDGGKFTQRARNQRVTLRRKITDEELAGAGLADITEFLDEISQSGGYREARSLNRYSLGTWRFWIADRSLVERLDHPPRGR